MGEVCFTVDTKNVFFENFADENVVVNITIGNYYSMKGSANYMWSLLQKPYNQSQLVEAILNKYVIDRTSAIPFVTEFLNALLNEQLLISIEEQTDMPLIIPVDQKIAFEVPVLEIYNDLQELLLLDPIHEVDDVQGWPTKK